MKTKWQEKKWVIAALHLLFWVILTLSPFLLSKEPDPGNRNHAKIYFEGFIILYLVNTAVRVIVFYLNANLLFPRYFYKGRYWQYALILAGALAIIFIVDYTAFHFLMRGSTFYFRNFLVFHLPTFVFLIVASAAYRTIKDRVTEDKRAKEKETENLKTELSFLRSQVSPHFMFNVLNNMVALARKKSDLLEPSLIKLSSLLRYMLYETGDYRVALEKEVEYLESYIDLQKQRFGKKVNIITKFEEVAQGQTIEPMLLIPFVENAFKHGTGLINGAEIIVELKVVEGNLNFEVRNKYNPDSIEAKDKTAGIGYANVKRRLDLLYKNNYSLNIDQNDGWYTVILQINLH